MARVFPFLKGMVCLEPRTDGRMPRDGAVELSSTKAGQVGESAGFLTLREVYQREINTGAHIGEPAGQLEVYNALALDRRYWPREVPVTLLGHSYVGRELGGGDKLLEGGLLMQRPVDVIQGGMHVFEDAHWIREIVEGIMPVDRRFSVEPQVTLVSGL